MEGFPASKTFSRQGLDLAYIDEGEGPPIVMVHGNPTWSFYYRGLIEAFRSEYRCLAPDHIGCGRSDKPEADRYPYTLARRIEDLEAWLASLDVRDVTLVVHDWGGAIGLGWAGRNPDRVARLVVLNTAAFGLPAGRRFPPVLTLARAPLLGSALVRGANAFVEGTIRWGVHRPLSASDAAGYRAPYRTWAQRVAVHRFIQDIPLRPGDPSAATLDEVTAGLQRLRDKPMLIAWGRRDFVFDDAFLAEWTKRRPDAEVEVFEDAGHLVLDDAGPAIIARLRTFLARPA